MAKKLVIKFKLLTKNAKLPSYAHSDDAGFDIYSTEDKTLKPGDWYAFRTGLASQLPLGFYVEIRGRSGLAHRNAIHVLGGTVDAGYRGEWQVILINLGRKTYKVEQGERIAQGVFLPVARAKIVESPVLSDSKRGTRGIGSTGRK